MLPKLHVLLTTILIAVFSFLSVFALGQSPTVYTDKKDYVPDDTVIIQGNGWQFGERVQLDINYSKVSLSNTTLYVTADANGYIYNKQFIIQSIHLGESFVLTATGLSSGLIAQTTFTDGTYNSRESGYWSDRNIWTVSRAGKIETSNSSKDVVGVGTNFLSELSVGDVITSNNDLTILGTIASIASDFQLTLETNATETHSESIGFNARRVPGLSDAVVINAHTVSLNQNANCANLNLTNNSSLIVGPAVVLTVNGTLTLQNRGDVSSSATLSGLGTINAQLLAIGNNSNITGTSLSHKLTTSVSALNVTGVVSIYSYVGTTTTRKSNGGIFLTSGTLIVGSSGGINMNNENGVNTSTLSIQYGLGEGTLILNSPIPFTRDGTGTYNILLNGTASTVKYTSNSDQNVYPTIYNNIVLGGTGTKSVDGITVNGMLSMQGTAAAKVAGRDMPIYNASSTLEYKGSAAQTTGIEFLPSAIQNVIIDNDNGVAIEQTNKLINKVLTLKKGVLNTGSFKVTIGPAGSISGGSQNSYVRGKLEMEFSRTGSKLFPIGQGTAYCPVTLEYTALSGSSKVLIQQFEAPLSNTMPANTVLFSERYWNITQTGASSFIYKVTFDGTGMTVPSGDQAVVFKRNSDGTIVSYDATTHFNEYMISGLTSFSEFGLGYRKTIINTAIFVADAKTIYGNTAVELVAAVTGDESNKPNAGTVTFYLKNSITNSIIQIGTAAVSSGKATLSDYNPSILSAGDYIIIASYGGADLFVACSSDDVAPKTNGTLTIAKKNITVTADAKTKVYGDTEPVLTYHITAGALVGEDVFSGVPKRVAGEDVGTYAINQNTLTAGGNYDLTYVGAGLAIDKALLTIAANDQTVNYGTDAAMVTGSGSYTPSGFKKGEMASVISGAITYNTTYTATTGAGTPGVIISPVVSDLSADNYSFTAVAGTVTIDKAPTNTVVDVSNVEYDGSPHGGAASVSGAGGLKQPLTITYTGTTKAGVTYNSTDIPTEAGDYVASASYAESPNHYSSEDKKSFSIAQAPATISLADLNKVYNGSAQGATVSTTPADLDITVAYNGSATVPTAAGSYNVMAMLNNSNYTATNGTGTLVIKQAKATISVVSYEVTYDGDAHTSSVTAKGVKGEDLVGLVDVSATTHTDAGSYTVDTWSFAGDNNYESDYGTVNNKIKQAKATIYVQGASVVYDGNEHGASGTATGVKGEELSILLDLGAKFTDVPGGAIFWSFLGNSNYESASGSVGIVINKADAKVIVNGYKEMFDGLSHGASGSAIGVKGEDLSSALNYGSKFVSPPGGTASWIFNGGSNYNNQSGEVEIRIFAIPRVTLVTPSPVQINSPSTINVICEGEVFNPQWNYTIVSPSSATPSQDNKQLNIISPSPVVYAVTLSYDNGMDKHFETDKAYAVFYDPNAGFVTGGGWITSPVFDLPFMKVGGKANFGFVSKYEKGKTVPSGNTEFQFQAGSLNFKSTVYEWLVISGSKAQYKGTGTINGSGKYGFMLTATDADPSSSTTVDLFRIKIWDVATGATVYDNQNGAADNADPTTAIGGGSIVIHTTTSGKKVNAISADATRPEAIVPTQFILKAFPNPSTSSFNVQVESDNTRDKINIRVLDLYGRTVEVFNGAYSGQTIKLGGSYRPGIYFVEMVQGAKHQLIKLLKGAE